MKLNYRSIGQRCTMDTKTGKRCRLPAGMIAGGLAVCPYHVHAAERLFREVCENNKNNPAFQPVAAAAARDQSECNYYHSFNQV